MIDSLWRMGLYGCVPIGMALAGRRLLRRYPKEYSCGLWILVFVRLLLPVFIGKPLGVQPLQYMGCLQRAGGKGLWASLYLAGVCLVSGYFLIQGLRIRRQLRPAVREMKNIWRCENISSAFVAGLIKPRIFLPYGLEGTERWYVECTFGTGIRGYACWGRSHSACTGGIRWSGMRYPNCMRIWRCPAMRPL